MTNPGQRGFSLVELMAATTITLVIMAGVFGLMIQNQNIYETQTRLADVQQSARVAIDLLTRDIRMAGSDPSGRAFEPPSSCVTSTYKTPAAAPSPSPGDVAPLTIAEAQRIRIKMDRATWTLYPEPSPAGYPSPRIDYSGDGDYEDDDEDGLGDGFLDDEAEDILYEYDSTAKKLYRTELRDLPAATCRPSATTTVSPSKLPIAENVVAFQLKYYTTDPPQTQCPTPGYSGDYETARDGCDIPITGTPSNYTAVKRVRIRLVVETNKPDPNRPKTSPKFGKQWITLTSEATIRSRSF